jgi:hypothetical protein
VHLVVAAPSRPASLIVAKPTSVKAVGTQTLEPQPRHSSAHPN